MCSGLHCSPWKLFLLSPAAVNGVLLHANGCTVPTASFLSLLLLQTFSRIPKVGQFVKCDLSRCTKKRGALQTAFCSRGGGGYPCSISLTVLLPFPVLKRDFSLPIQAFLCKPSVCLSIQPSVCLNLVFSFPLSNAQAGCIV